MSAETKIWFVYLSDHHEGPFTPEEVAEKVKQGVVTAQSLGWKDGMPEWVPLEAIPELSAALSGGGSAAAGGDEGFSLAQMLSSQQQGGVAEVTGGGPAPADAGSDFTGATSVLSSMVQNAMNNNPVEPGSLSIDLGAGSGANAAPTSGAAPSSGKSTSGAVNPDAEVWTLKIGTQVSGMHSLNKLKSIAADGEIPPDAMVWRSGWSDFQAVSAVPEIAQARKAKKNTAAGKTGAIATNKNIKGGSKMISAVSDLGSDDPTDPNIVLSASTEKKGFKGILAKISSLLKRKKTAAAAQAIAKNQSAKVTAAKAGIGKRMSVSGVGESLKKVVMALVAVVLLGGGGAVYFLFFSSPFPSDLDVLPEELENMTLAAKGDQGQKIFLALARGTEDNPADDTAPKFYVATALPDGTEVTLQLTGQPGTLVNRTSFQKSFTAKVAKNLATFESIQDDGKPLPMGEYDLKVSAEGADPYTVSRFLGGKKGGIYQDRLKRYKEKLQGEYDKEMAELKELIDTLKSLNGEISKRSSEYKSSVTNPSLKGKMAGDWRNFSMGAQVLVGQIDQKVKAKVSAAGTSFHPRALQDIATTLANVQSFLQSHAQRVEGSTPATNPDELEASITTSVSALEQWLAQALIKSPLDVLSAPKDAADPSAAPAVTPGASASPSAPAAPTTPPPAPAP